MSTLLSRRNFIGAVELVAPPDARVLKKGAQSRKGLKSQHECINNSDWRKLKLGRGCRAKAKRNFMDAFAAFRTFAEEPLLVVGQESKSQHGTTLQQTKSLEELIQVEVHLSML